MKFLTDLVREAAARNGPGVAVKSPSGNLTWKAFEARIARTAGALLAAGVGRGERVAVLAANSAELLEMTYAVMWCGAILVPLNFRLAAPELAWILGHCEAGTLVHDERMRKLAGEALARQPVPRRLELEAFCRAQSAAPAAPQPDVLAGLFYTGGTTGLPKGVMISHEAELVQARNVMQTMALDRGSVFLHAMPLFHVAGAASAHATAAAQGANAFMPVFDPAGLYASIRDEGVDSLALAPTMFAALLDSPARDDSLLRRVRSLCYGAAPITPSLCERLLGAFPAGRIQQYYGQTECAGACLVLPSERHVTSGPLAGKLASAGHALPGFEVRVVDATDKDVPAGTPGEIVVRGAAVMQGYWKDEARSAEALRGGWLHTGDVGVMDAEGFVTVVDRLKDMIVTGAENVYSSEVEAALAAHPEVAACAVIGLPDERWGERVHAVVVPRPGASPGAEALIEFCKGRIAGYKCPKSITLRAEPLPLSGVGKVQKNLLREQLTGNKR